LHAKHLFFKEGEIIPHTQTDLEFVDCVSIKFERQKREEKAQHGHTESLGVSVLCPVQFAASLVWRIGSYKGMDSSTQVSAYTRNGIVVHVTSTQVITALRNMVGVIGETCLGISKQEMGTHSIRSGAAMAMYLGKCSLYTIMLIDQWSSNAFLHYICKQVMQFSHKVSKKMLCFKNYQLVPNYDHWIAANALEFATARTML
jgi:hypothetical protein